MEHLIKGEHDWHEKINAGFDELSDMVGKTAVTVRVEETINKQKWYEVFAQDFDGFLNDEAVNLTMIVNNGAGLQLGLLSIKIDYTEGVVTPIILWSYSTLVDMNDYAIEVSGRRWRLCTYIKATESVKTFELIARSSMTQVGFPTGMPELEYESLVTRYIQTSLSNPILSRGGTDAAAIMYGDVNLKSALDTINSSLNIINSNFVYKEYPTTVVQSGTVLLADSYKAPVHGMYLIYATARVLSTSGTGVAELSIALNSVWNAKRILETQLIRGANVVTSGTILLEVQKDVNIQHRIIQTSGYGEQIADRAMTILLLNKFN